MKPRISAIGMLLITLASPNVNAAPKVGDTAPELGLEQVLQAPADTTVSWQTLQGKVVVLEFWATWCAPCIAAIPHLNELADEFKGKPVQFIAITDEDSKVVEPFLKKRPMRAWIGLDRDKSMFKAYGVSSIPHTVIVNTNGEIAAITYPMTLKREHIENLLAGKPAGLAERKASDLQVKADAAGTPASAGKPALFQVIIRPSEETAKRMSAGPAGKTEFGIAFEYKLYGSTVAEALPTAFGVTSARLVTDAQLPEGRFDFLLRLPQKQSDRLEPLLQDALRTSFGLVSRKEERESDAYILKVKDPGHQGLPETASTGGMSSSFGPGRIGAIKGSMSGLARSLESVLDIPVFNETKLEQKYDYQLKWNQTADEPANAEAVIAALRDQLGLDLVKTKRQLEFVIVASEQNVKGK
jgi:uncharacterized protein (TIGR03435 family)